MFSGTRYFPKIKKKICQFFSRKIGHSLSRFRVILGTLLCHEKSIITKKLQEIHMVFKAIWQDFRVFNFLFRRSNRLVASQNDANHIFSSKIEAFVKFRKSSNRFRCFFFKENTEIFHFSDHWEIFLRVQEHETTKN